MANLSSINYDMLVDVPIKVTVELGRSQMTVQEILGLEKGSVIELNRIAGDPVDVFVNDYLIAKGEVVVVDDNFGVRITQIVASPSIVEKN
jgi:flagellar motor switch protein FliN/FliY